MTSTETQFSSPIMEQHFDSSSPMFQPSDQRRQKVRFSEEEHEIIPIDKAQQATVDDKAIEKFWYTRKELVAFRSAVRQECAYILHVLDVESNRCHNNSDRCGPMMIANDNDDEATTTDNEMEHETDNTGTCRMGLEPYLDPGRCIIRTEMIQTLVEYSERLLDVEEVRRLEGHSPSPDRVRLVLARMAVRATKTSRLRAFEEGHANFCEVYPDRAMESPRQWEAYRRVLQRKEQRQQLLLQKRQQRRIAVQRRNEQQQQQQQQQPQQQQQRQEHGRPMPCTVIPMDDTVQTPMNEKRRRTTTNTVCSLENGHDVNDSLRAKRVCIR